jgi:iron complex outermembrane recepter protein
MRAKLLTTVTVLASFASLSPVLAQNTAEPVGENGVEVIVVTALRREQSLQDVSASITALGSRQLAASGISNSFDLQQRVPGLAISYGNRETSVAIRGVSNNVRSVGSDPSNAVHLDGIYLPQSSMVLTDLFDIERVEVLKGPQGTLYGRNATGGAINVISRRPQSGSGLEGSVGAGSNNLIRAQAALNFGTQTIAARIAGSYVKDDGYTKNILKGTNLDAQDSQSIRGQVRFQISPNLDLTLLAQVGQDDGTVGYGISTDARFKKFPDNFYGLVVPASLQRIDERNIRLDSPVFSERTSEVYGATLNWAVGNLLIKSITSATRYDASDALDYDFTGDFNEVFTSQTKVESISQEVTISNSGDGSLQWTAGLYLYNDEGSQSVNWLAPGPFANAESTSSGDATAIFGQATYKVTEKFSVMAGARYNDETKSGTSRNLLARPVSTSTVKTSFDSFTPEAQIQYRPNEDILFYAGVSKGFKSGGFNLLAAGTPTKYDPETIVAYESGLRASLPQSRTTFNVAAFRYDYTDLQLRTLVFTGTGGGAVATVSNAAAARINGLEVNSDIKIGDGFSIDVGASFLDAKFLNYISPSNRLDLSGTRLPLAPTVSGTVGLAYVGDLAGGALRARVEYVYRSQIIFPLTIDAPENFDGPSSIYNATLRWTEPKKRYYLEVVGRNLGDALYRVQRGDVFFSGVYDSFGAPQTAEVRVGFNF